MGVSSGDREPAGDDDGNIYNVNADTVAESIAVALQAMKLIFMTGAPGVLRDRNDPSSLVTFADPDDLATLMASGASPAGCARKWKRASVPPRAGWSARTSSTAGRPMRCCSRYSPAQALAP
jgi:acetylglutamate kinase